MNEDTSWRTTDAHLPSAWSGRFLAVYPDGTRGDYDLDGHVLAAGDELPGGGYVLDHWEVTKQPVADGKPMLVGILRLARS